MDNVFREIKQEITFFSTRSLDFPAHIHEDIEMVYVRKGGGVAYCDGKKYQMTTGTFFLVFPNQVHHYVGCTTGEYVLLIMKPSTLLCNHEMYLKGYPKVASRYIDDVNTVSLLNMALSEYQADGYSSVIAAYLTALLEKLTRMLEIEKEKISGDTVLRILQYCAAHYKEDITVTDVANELAISKSTVSHIFSSRLAISFCDHINSLRLNDADSALIKKYAELRNITVSELIRQTILERIEEEFDLAAYEKAAAEYRANPVTYSHEEVKKMLELD